LFEDTGIDSCYLKGNTKGFHIWLQFERGKPDLFKQNFVQIGLPTTIDFLGEKVFERVEKDWVGTERCYLQPDQIKKCFTPSEKKENVPSNVPFNDITL
jgi:hypothetical protein